MIENLILDWSGTLADDLPLTLNATNATLVEFGGEPIDLDTYRREFRIPVMSFYDPRVPGRTLAEIDDAFFRHYRTRLGQIPFYDGVEDLLRIVAGRGLRVFLLSTVPSELLEAALAERGLLSLVDGIYGGATDKREVMPRLIEEHSLHRDRTLFVGDTLHDVETARLARVRAGASLYGYGLEDAMRRSGADYYFTDVAALRAELDRHHLVETVPLVIATVGGIVQDGEGRILVVRTLKWSDTFGIPGGKIAYGETMLEAYLREMKEETNLELVDTRFVMVQDCIESPEFVKPRHFLLINYVSRAVDPGRLACNYELEEARWVTPPEALRLNLNAPTRVVIEEAARQGFLGPESAATAS